MSVLYPASNEKDISKIVTSVQQLCQGRCNNTGVVTLTVNSATTTVTAPNCGADSVVLLFPQSANAAAEFVAGTLRIGSADIDPGVFIITHVNSATAGRTFRWVAIG